MELDQLHGNTLWRIAEELELQQIDAYDTLSDLGHLASPPPRYKKLHVHMTYTVKHDMKRKAYLVANGNLTEVPLDNIYSSVVSLRGLCLTIFLAELDSRLA